jgi:hypothetical protein
MSPRGLAGDDVHSVIKKYSMNDDMSESIQPGPFSKGSFRPETPRGEGAAARGNDEKRAVQVEESYAGDEPVESGPTLGQLVKRVREIDMTAENHAPEGSRDDRSPARAKLKSGKNHWQTLKKEVSTGAAKNQARKTFMRMLTGTSSMENDDKDAPVAPTGVDNAPSKVAFDDNTINRISLRLDGFESYSVLGALVLGFALNNISAVTGEDFEGVPWIITFLFVVICVITSFASMYTLMVFALCSLYGKTSLGIKNDAGYTKFIQQTAPFREWAFINFMVSLMGTCISVLYLLLLKTPSQGIIASPICAACIYYGQKHVRSMIKIASATVFS